jgi:putative ABC transport system permease protein
MNIWLLLLRRNFLRRRLRAVLTIIGISLGIALIFGVYTTKDAALRSFINLVDDLGGQADLQVSKASNLGFNANIAKKVTNVKGVSFALPSIHRSIFLLKNGQTFALEVLGVDSSNDKRIRKYKLSSGRFLKASDQQAVLLNRDFAAEKGIKIGDQINLTVSQGRRNYKVIGLLESVGVGRAAQGQVLVSTLKTVQEMFALEKYITQVDVKISNEDSVKVVKKRLKKTLGSAYEIDMPQRKGSTMATSIDFLTESFRGFGYLVLISGALLILSTFRMNIQERQKEIGILRALGANRRQVLRSTLVEAAAYGIVGVLLGLILGWYFSLSLLKVLTDILKTTVTAPHFSLGATILTALLGLVTSLGAALWPAYKAGLIPPIAIIKLSKRDRSSWLTRYSWLIGITFLGLGLLIYQLLPSHLITYQATGVLTLIGTILSTPLFVNIGARLFLIISTIFGAEGKIASRNVTRTIGRSSVGVAALAISIILILLIGALGVSQKKLVTKFIDTVVSFDIEIGSAPFSVASVNRYPPMPYKTRQQVEQIPGVKKTQPVKFLAIRTTDKKLMGMFVDPNVNPPGLKSLEEGNGKKAIAELNQGNHIIVSSHVAKTYHLNLGDHLRLQTLKGWRRFKVSGVVLEIANNGDNIWLSRKDLKRYWGSDGIDMFSVIVKKGYSIDQVRQKLEKAAGQPMGLPVIRSDELRTEINQASSQFFAAMQTLIILALLVSTVGIINILAMNVIERRQEIGVLRAIGSRRGQIRKTIFLEAELLGLIGGFLGLAIGLPLSKIFIQMSEAISASGYEYFLPTAAITSSLVIALLVSFIAALYPANQAARKKIIEAIRYE